MTVRQVLLRRTFGLPGPVLGRIGAALMVTGNSATEERAVALGDLARSDRVLVVGCGPGVGVVAAARRAHAVVALDPSVGMVVATTRRALRAGLGARVLVGVGTADSIGARAGSFDAVVSVNNIQLWPSFNSGFRELRRVLRPGGRLVVSVHQSSASASQDRIRRSAHNNGLHLIEECLWDPPSRLAGRAWQFKALAI